MQRPGPEDRSATAPPRPSARRGASLPVPGGAKGSIVSLIKDVWRQSQQDDVLNLGAGIAFFAFLSLPPTILVLFALAGFLGDDRAAEWLTVQLGALLPEEAEMLVHDFVDTIIYEQAPGLFSVSLLIALWAASNVFMALTRALNTAYGIEDARPWLKQRALALVVMLLFLLFFLAGSVILVTGPQIARALDLWGTAEVVWNLVQLPLSLLLVVAAFWACYYILPARDQAASKSETLQGAAVATLLWVIATLGFRFYIANFASYADTYGFIGGFIILLLWLYITGLVLLIGGELASALEQRSAA